MADKMEISEVKDRVHRGLEKVRWQLLNKSPFIGEMLLRFSITPTYDCRLDTAATDGKKIYFDCEFYSTLNDEERQFILAHEVWHNIFLHFTRMCTRDQNLWNIATDMEINYMLKNDGFAVLRDACMPDPQVAGKSAEQIYDYLLKQQQKQNKNQKNNQNSKGGSGDDDDSQNDSDGSGDSENGNSSNKGGKPGSGKKKNDGQFDTHIYEGDRDKPGQKREGKWGEKGFDKDFNPGMKNGKDIENAIKEMVCSAAQSIERKQGHLPAGIDHIVSELLKPEINWKEALSQFVTKCLGDDRSWRRCSRHALGRGMYLPGTDGEKIKVVCAIDTSGSCLGDLPKFLGELNGLLGSFGDYEVTLVQCDAEVHESKTYDNNDPFEPKDFQVKGCGGTSFTPVFDWVREHNENEFNCLVYFTDGYGDAPNNPPPYPVLWVLTSDGCENFCSWGQKMRFKESSLRQ